MLATLMSIIGFFGVLMLFAANPFSASAASVPLDGEGLNPLLQNYWMMIHPPTLYMGFVGWSVPFAFCVAALVTGRLKDEWIIARAQMDAGAWSCSSHSGNLLGVLWATRSWAGAATGPGIRSRTRPSCRWLAGTAYLHSVMIQERRGMLKVWNVFLMCLTFIMTIFGTFLTRSGLIASVHSFARSDIGIYFAWYLVFLCVVCLGLIFYRLPLCARDNRIDSMLSREFAFLLQNWVLLGMMVFVLIATTFPLISEAIRGETVTVGPGFYNKWMVPLGLVLMLLTGIGPLISWRAPRARISGARSAIPCWRRLVVFGLQLTFGAALGFPAYVAERSHLRHHDGSCAGRHLRHLARCERARVHLRARHHRAGVLARHPRAHEERGRGCAHGAVRVGHARQASLRRLHRARQHRADVLGLYRRGLRHREGSQSAPGQRLDRRELRAALRPPAHGGRPEQAHDLHRPHRVLGGKPVGTVSPGQVHLPDASGHAHHRSGHSLHAHGRRLRDHEQGQSGDQGRHFPRDRAAVGGLDLDRRAVVPVRLLRRDLRPRSRSCSRAVRDPISATPCRDSPVMASWFLWLLVLAWPSAGRPLRRSPRTRAR